MDPAWLFALGSSEEAREEGASWKPPEVAEVARLFPEWEIRKLIGGGAMGAVYLAHQPELDRAVAIKLLPKEACREERQVERFRREARTLAKLRHPGIVSVIESGMTSTGHLFLVMEYVDGEPLSELIARGAITVQKALEIVRQICDALTAAHEIGIVHRDLKPSNVIIDRAGNARLADFGLARPNRPAASQAITLTYAGGFLGTPGSKAREQARDSTSVDHRADIYSLGVLFYEMPTGEIPRGVFRPPSRKVGATMHRLPPSRPRAPMRSRSRGRGVF